MYNGFTERPEVIEARKARILGRTATPQTNRVKQAGRQLKDDLKAYLPYLPISLTIILGTNLAFALGVILGRLP